MKRNVWAAVIALAVVGLATAFYLLGPSVMARVSFEMEWRDRDANAQASACEAWAKDPSEAWQRFNLSDPMTALSTTQFSSNMQRVCPQT